MLLIALVLSRTLTPEEAFAGFSTDIIKIIEHLGLWAAQQRPPPADFIATESIGGVLPQVAEDSYPYDPTGWESDEPA
jgi:hypothetical protein